MNRTIFRFMFLLLGCGGTEKIDVESPQQQSSPAKKLTIKEVLRNAIDADDRGEPQKARRLYLRVLDNKPQHPVANYRFVHFLLAQSDEREALDVAEKYNNSSPEDREGAHVYVDALKANKEYEQAINVLDNLVDSDDQDAAALEKRGRILTAMSKKSGLKDLKTAVDIEPEEPEFRNSYALALSRFGKKKLATRQIKKSLELDEDEVSTWLAKGVLERNQRNYKRAVKSQKKAIELEPEHARAHFELGVTFNLMGANDKAEESIGISVDLDPGNKIYWSAYADILRLTKHYKDSVIAYERTLDLDPDNLKAKLHLAETLIRIDRGDEAEAIIVEVLDNDPENKRALALIQRFDQ